MKDSFTLNELIQFSDNMFHNAKKKHLSDDSHNDESSVLPDDRIIANILNYSRALNVIRTKRAGTINLLMN